MTATSPSRSSPGTPGRADESAANGYAALMDQALGLGTVFASQAVGTAKAVGTATYQYVRREPLVAGVVAAGLGGAAAGWILADWSARRRAARRRAEALRAMATAPRTLWRTSRALATALLPLGFQVARNPFLRRLVVRAAGRAWQARLRG